MAIIIHERPDTGLKPSAIDRWRRVPPAVAIDLDSDMFEIDPKVRRITSPGRHKPLFGRAVTAACEPPDFGPVLYASDLIGPGDVLVIAAAGNPDFAMIGEIVSDQLRRQGGAGVIVDGAIRDVDMIATFEDFAAFARHITPRGPKSANKGSINTPVNFGGRTIHAGDLIIGDGDGLAVIPVDAIKTHIKAAENKLTLEEHWQQSLKSGKTFAETFNLPDPEKS